MSDLSEINATEPVKIAGADATGLEQVFVQALTSAPSGSEGGLVVRNIPSGTQNVTGNVASGSTDSGNPVKIGGVFNSILPVVTAGQRVDLQLDQNGRLLTSSVSLPTTASKFSFGDINSTATTLQAVLRTAYTEPTTNSTMTIVSSSAADAAAGTGARTVTVTYLDQTAAGPFTTTATLNGTTPVNLVSGMCFVEKIIVNTVGSGASNAGILTLKTGSAVTVGTIAVGDNQTFWAHHYIPTGKTSYVSGFSVGSSSSTVGAGAVYVLKVSQPTVANSVEYQASDFVTLYGQSSTTTRSYISPIQIIGPARVRAYATPLSPTSNLYRASFDYIDN